MLKVSFDTPSLYADHHVIEIRRVLLEMPGIQEVYASSCFRVVEVSYDPAQIDAETIHNRLAATGYLEPLPVLNEMGGYAQDLGDKVSSFRKTRIYEQVKQSISFNQEVPQEPRAGWPCPGMGLLKSE